MLMTIRTIIYTRLNHSQIGTDEELVNDLRQAVEDRGDVVVAVFVDDGRITGRGKNAGWRRLLENLLGIDQIVVATAGDLPGRTAHDLFKILGHLREHNVSLRLHREDIDTSSGSPAVLDLTMAYRTAKLSLAIRNGQAKARAVGKRIGRPPIPANVRHRILAALAEGAGVRATAKRFNLSRASVINIRRSMASSLNAEAA
jgi:DNA invertase Pin-like site-specific DNA recombinase